MDQNPYQAPRDPAPLVPQPHQSHSSNRLRTFGVASGMICTTAFFVLMGFVWRNDSSPLLDDTRFQTVVLTGVAIIIIVGIVSLLAIFV